MFNACLLKNICFTNNTFYVHSNLIQKIKNQDKLKFRYYNIKSITKNSIKPINVKGTTIHYLFKSHNIAHFLYDTFFHLMYVFETCNHNNIKIDNLMLYIENNDLRKFNFNEECIHNTGNYNEASHFWCMSVLLSYIHDLNINLIIQKKDINYRCENIILVGEDRGLRFPRLANILKNKVLRYVQLKSEVLIDILIYNRKDSRRRIILNDIELANKLKEHNLKVKLIDSFSNISFYEQIKLLNSCKTFISPTGANMTNIVFMNRDITILEVDKRNSWPLMYGTYKLFKKYYSVKYEIIYNKNKSNPNGSIQANPDFDNNFNIDIDDAVNFILKQYH